MIKSNTTYEVYVNFPDGIGFSTQVDTLEEVKELLKKHNYGGEGGDFGVMIHTQTDITELFRD